MSKRIVYVVTEKEHHCDDKATIKFVYQDNQTAIRAMNANGFKTKIADNFWMNSCNVVRQITECELI